MLQNKKRVNIVTKNLEIRQSGKFLLIFYIGLCIFLLILASCALFSKEDGANFLAYVAIITSLLSIILTSVSVFFIFVPLTQSLESERIKNIEAKLDKFYIPLYNLLTNQNEITDYQEKINEIGCYIHLAEFSTCCRFKTYQETNWFRDELLEAIKRDMEKYQIEYREITEDLF